MRGQSPPERGAKQAITPRKGPTDRGARGSSRAQAAGLAAAVRDGDLVFQISRSAQSRAIQEAQGSPWSHVGIVFHEGDAVRVLEAVQPVRYTPLAEWQSRGQDARVEVRRLRDSDRVLTGAALSRLRAAGERMLGLAYDLRFEWSDRAIYCSELVWKMYERALDIELSEPQVWRDLELTGTAVQKLAKRRLGGMPDPDAPIVTPRALMESSRLVRVSVGELPGPGDLQGVRAWRLGGKGS